MPVLTPFLVVLSGVLGLIIGSFLNVVAVRVPVGASLVRESRCPKCDAAIKPWHNIPVGGWLILRGRCASCGNGISPRYPLVEAATGVAFALVAWLVSSTSTAPLPAMLAVLVAYLYFAAVSIVLTIIDLDTHRLPNPIVLPSYLVGAGLFGIACVLGADWSRFIGALIGMAALYAFYFAIRLVRPDGMGGGDVKLAGVVGLYLGWISWGALAVGAFAAFLLGGIFGLALIAARQAGRRTAIPFGPWILAGAWVGIVAGQPLGELYISLFTV